MLFISEWNGMLLFRCLCVSKRTHLTLLADEVWTHCFAIIGILKKFLTGLNCDVAGRRSKLSSNSKDRSSKVFDYVCFFFLFFVRLYRHVMKYGLKTPWFTIVRMSTRGKSPLFTDLRIRTQCLSASTVGNPLLQF